MSDHVTPAEAREFMEHSCSLTARGEHVIRSLADQVESLTKERDALRDKLADVDAEEEI